MHFLYILLCSDKTLYTGITNNLTSQLDSLKAGRGSKYVVARLPFRLVYKAIFPDKISAIKRQKEIKGWRREKKVRVLGLRVG